MKTQEENMFRESKGAEAGKIGNHEYRGNPTTTSTNTYQTMDELRESKNSTVKNGEYRGEPSTTNGPSKTTTSTEQAASNKEYRDKVRAGEDKAAIPDATNASKEKYSTPGPQDNTPPPTATTTPETPSTTTVPSTTPTTDGTDETDGTDGTGVNPRDTLTSALMDPSQFLIDNKLTQQYTDLEVNPDEIQDINANQLEVIDPLEAITTTSPDALKAAQDVTVGDITSEQMKEQEAVKAAASVQMREFEAALIDPSTLKKSLDEIEKLEPMKAASMAKEMDGLLQDLESGNVPLWARPAVTQVEQMLAGRGISASSIGRDSLFNAIIQAAMPIAQQDASFKQDAFKTNYTAKVNAVMSDVNMEFAAKQFNANSINQTNQFKTQIKAQIDMSNATRQDQMAQFNSQLKFNTEQVNVNASNQAILTQAQLQNTSDLQNAARQDQMAQFNTQTAVQSEQFNTTQVNAMTQMTAQLQGQRDQFNAQMATQIEQSNITWRRQVNQANTAGVNAVNQANVQNAFNLSNQALTFLWQEMRDEAQWEFQSNETEKDRKNQLEATLLANETAMGGEVGKTIENLVNGTKFMDSFLDMWS